MRKPLFKKKSQTFDLKCSSANNTEVICKEKFGKFRVTHLVNDNLSNLMSLPLNPGRPPAAASHSNRGMHSRSSFMVMERRAS